MKDKLEFDRYDLGIIINALQELRNNQIRLERPTDAIDELLLKIIPMYETIEKKTKLVKCLRKDESRRI